LEHAGGPAGTAGEEGGALGDDDPEPHAVKGIEDSSLLVTILIGKRPIKSD